MVSKYKFEKKFKGECPMETSQNYKMQTEYKLIL
ncbi:hypothetical protein BC952_1319 [Flavobacterium limicola]|uniref:Uncharacterized protein n=1 Tax=Flavobacterium limicola TaxID=180441 RepID=A0A495S8G6_9FLAO|nr:hypothetical protein BC952_1319 [Flavobacterium limicola]